MIFEKIMALYWRCRLIVKNKVEYWCWRENNLILQELLTIPPIQFKVDWMKNIIFATVAILYWRTGSSYRLIVKLQIWKIVEQLHLILVMRTVLLWKTSIRIPLSHQSFLNLIIISLMLWIIILMRYLITGTMI